VGFKRGRNGGADGAHRGRGKNGGDGFDFSGADSSPTAGVDWWSPGCGGGICALSCREGNSAKGERGRQWCSDLFKVAQRHGAVVGVGFSQPRGEKEWGPGGARARARGVRAAGSGAPPIEATTSRVTWHEHGRWKAGFGRVGRYGGQLLGRVPWGPN
jgi:hypothetical protein